MSTATIVLDYPVTIQEKDQLPKTYETLTMHRPRIIDFLNKEKHALVEPVERACNARFLAALCDVPEAVIYELDEYADYEKLIKALDSFLPRTEDSANPEISNDSPLPLA
jgi:hypothetical protein